MSLTTSLSPEPVKRPRRTRLPPALRAYQYNLLAYKRTWRGSLTTTFLYPVLYLAAMGIGLGHLIDHGSSRAVEGVPYVWFLAPGLLAATAMQIGANESTFPVMAGIKWLKTYLAMLATPLEVTDVLYGHLLWITTRVAVASGVFLAVMAAFHTVPSVWAVAAFPAAVLTGAAFAAPVMAFSATRETDQSFIVLYRFGVVPLFLFSGTFFPIAQLPPWLQVVARGTPLYQGVSLCRDLVLGHPGGWETLAHAGYLLVMLVGGVLAARATYRRRLVQ
ncbi:MAG TPA: ABC transporter permease [Acidimicrobiales bacterium]|nr:ABC transporter permease [Acidimicrobiales bacterium]